ncbi:MAG: SdrD B-like domain-containing protein, partial [Gemmatimonadota bacterium]
MKRIKYFALAALVAFAACSEGSTTDVTPTPTGTISGQVTIEGVGASGITVTLSSGATATTDGTGNYSFDNVEAGSYTVSVSGFASDVTFSASSKAATISTSGQVVTVNFDGSYVRTSVITGQVAAGSSGLEGVTVSIGSSSTTTDANGLYAFSGLKAGTYTVSISGYDAAMYTFPATSYDVTVAVGESKVQNFSGQLQTTASITGTLFVDENVKNGTYDSTEQPLAVANVTITLQNGLNDPNPQTTQTAADGSYSFTGLAAGTYQISIAASDTTIIPANYALGGASSQIVTTTAGSATPVNWPFNIVRQTVKVGAFLGRDAGVAMVAPITGVTIDLYPTEADLNALTNKLGTAETDATGYASIVFKRSDEKSPAGGASDNIVFANYVSAPSAFYTLNGETKLEIDYDPTTAVATGNDVFDFIYTQVVLGFAGQEIDGDSLPGWVTHTRVNDTTSTTGQVVQPLNAQGMTYVMVNWTGSVSSPDSLYTRLTPAQTLNGGHAWKQTPMPDMATTKGSFLQYNWDGTVLPSDTVMLGHADVKYLDSDVVLRLHREADDTAGFTLG